MPPLLTRQSPIGAELLSEGGVHFRVWAPKRKKVEVILYRDSSSGDTRDGNSRDSNDTSPQNATAHPLAPEAGGYFSAHLDQVQAGALYKFRLDGGDAFPDPASRFQPDGPHGPSQVVDPTRFSWTDHRWPGVSIAGQVIYEMHIGTFTPEGTWSAAAEELPELSALGITVIEVMPVAEFPGDFGWGYDGVDLFAPTRLYGRPDDFRRFVDRAHACGVAVILDVVYNHFGPDGNYLRQFSDAYFAPVKTDWGEAINFDAADSGPVREFFLANTRYWVREFHLDGLRLDATQQIYDSSADSILQQITQQVRAAAGDRNTIVVAENEPQEAILARPESRGGYGMDALWNDDFHHSAMVALTGQREAYYTDYLGTPQEFISCLKHGFLYQGQRYKWQEGRRGTSSFDLPPSAFVLFLQNHDQIANSGAGERVHQLTSPGHFRALTALVLLAPCTPMLFQGQEFAASTPFLYFASHGADLGRLVRDGRLEFLSQFPSLLHPEVIAGIADPGSRSTFERCKLDLSERQKNAGTYALHKDLLALRRNDPVFSRQAKDSLDGAVLSTRALVLRFFAPAAQDDRLLLLNLGPDLHLDPAPEPLLAPPEGCLWSVLWSSRDPRYGGAGTPALDTEDNWRIPGEATVVLYAQPDPSQATVRGRKPVEPGIKPKARDSKPA